MVGGADLRGQARIVNAAGDSRDLRRKLSAYKARVVFVRDPVRRRLDPMALETTAHCGHEASIDGGECEIRTHGRLPVGSFQDCWFKPLTQLSGAAPGWRR